jgi:hypothetical protein
VDERSLETVISAFEDLAAQITSVQSELGLKSVETTKRGRKFGYDYAQGIASSQQSGSDQSKGCTLAPSSGLPAPHTRRFESHRSSVRFFLLPDVPELGDSFLSFPDFFAIILTA